MRRAFLMWTLPIVGYCLMSSASCGGAIATSDDGGLDGFGSPPDAAGSAGSAGGGSDGSSEGGYATYGTSGSGRTGGVGGASGSGGSSGAGLGGTMGTAGGVAGAGGAMGTAAGASGVAGAAGSMGAAGATGAGGARGARGAGGTFGSTGSGFSKGVAGAGGAKGVKGAGGMRGHGTGEAGSDAYAALENLKAVRRHAVVLAPGGLETFPFAWHDAIGPSPAVDMEIEAEDKPLLQVFTVGARPFVRSGLDVTPIVPGARYDAVIARADGTVKVTLVRGTDEVILRTEAPIGDARTAATVLLPSLAWRSALITNY